MKQSATHNEVNPNPKKDVIRVVGARVHNLKNVSVEIPKGKLTVFTGLSGSGKSSLAFDTIYAEGQRRYMESLSSYARQFLGNLTKPDVDYIEGLTPAIAIDQQSAARSPRSTVGTMSDVYDYLRLLFARLGTPHCPTCQTAMQKATLVVAKEQRNGETRRSEAQSYVCYTCDRAMPEIDLGSFSFNTPEGACPDCQGLGVRLVIKPNLVVPNPRLTLAEGAIRPWARTSTQSVWYHRALEAFATHRRISLQTPIASLGKAILKYLFYGDPESGFEGVIPNLERRYRETDSDYLKREIEKYMVRETCPTCEGQRLRPDVLGIKIDGKNIVDMVKMTIADLALFFRHDFVIPPGSEKIALPILRELIRRTQYLADVGLNYLTLDRNADTLAGGEAQRIRLATQLGSQLGGVIYILDEPSIGLHPRDHERMVEVLRTLRDLGNTVIVVEHDEHTIRMADWVIDVGPGAGQHGGEIVAIGQPAQIAESHESLTGDYLAGRKMIEVPAKRRASRKGTLRIEGAATFNLKNITVDIPLGRFVCVSGVSGSGKSTLVDDILVRYLAKLFHRAKASPGKHERITGADHLDKVIAIDQSPIGRTPRSNPATYVNVFSLIRDVYAELPEAKDRKLSPSKFSFNLKGGRCEACRGEGHTKVEMHFLPDIYTVCAECEGSRYKPEILEVRYKERSIAEILEMTVEEATRFFTGHEQIEKKLELLEQVGLGYLKLGQPATTLSGGEAQRIKLATELARPSTGRTLYVLDEPTSGLHFEDIRRLLVVLQALVDKGNTVLVIEHNLDVIKSADWVIDMGPDGGAAGGEVVVAGTPEKVAAHPTSITASYLKQMFTKLDPRE